MRIKERDRGSTDGSLPYDGVVLALSKDGTEALWEVVLPASPVYGSLAVADDVVYFQSPLAEDPTDPNATPTWALYAVRANNGGVLARLTFEGDRALNGPAVSDGRVYAAFGMAFNFELAGPTPEGGVVCLGLPSDTQ